MTVSSTRKDYDKFVARWQMVRDVLDSCVSKYIADIDPADPNRNHRYRADAQFTNFTSRTKYGLVGAVFRKDLIIDVPKEIEYIKSDVTGTKISMSKLAQEVTGEVIATGRYGLLCDFPAIQGGLTVAEAENSDIKARIYRYNAESIINWYVNTQYGYPQLSLVVLKECVDAIDPDDGFKWIESYQYRVLRLVEGIYVQELYNADEELVSSYIPTDYNGDPFEEIPFVIVGSEDNDMAIDIVPLFDLARLNLGHYKNSADYEESVHIVGQPTLFITTEMTTDEFSSANPNGIQVGARRGYNLGPNGNAQFLQADPNQLADKAMERKEQQAVMIGARLITKQADRETAEAAVMRNSGENSILYTIAGNVEEALNRACTYLMMFMAPGSIVELTRAIKVNRTFFDKNVDPNLIMAQIQLLDKGLVAKTDVRDTLRNFGMIAESRTDEQIDSDVEPADLVQVIDTSLNPNGTDV